jgi:hypothetical protein
MITKRHRKEGNAKFGILIGSQILFKIEKLINICESIAIVHISKCIDTK